MRVEPSGEHRNIAAQQYQMFRAYLDAGFTQDQAIQLLKAIIRGAS